MAEIAKNAKNLALPEQDEWSGPRLRGAVLISVIVALMLTLLLEALDQTIVGTALPRIIGVFQGFDRYTWVVTVYVLASTTMVPIVGKLSDLFGRKWFLISGAAIFLVGSLLSGASQSMNQLILFRAIQGLGAGIGIALVNTVVADMFAPAERARWSAVFGAVYGFANLIGPTVGGWLTDHGPLVANLVSDDTRWRWIFYINLPIGILALIALLIFLPKNISVRTSQFNGWASIRRIDFLGATLATAATIALLLGLTWGSNQIYAWDSVQIVGSLIGAGVLYLAFFLTEFFTADPILPLDLFRNRVFSVAAILSLLQMMVLMGMMLYLPFFLQGVLGESATSSGAAITPLSFTMVIGAMIAGMLIAFTKRYQIMTIVASVILCVGIFLLSRMDATTGIGTAIVYMVLAGLGVGVFFSVLGLASQNALPRTRLGVGTAAVRYLAQLGATLGIAVVGTVVNSSLASDLIGRVPASVVKQLTPAGWKAATDPQVLVNSDAHNAVVKAAQQAATRNVPAGPQHAIIVQQIMHQVSQMLDQVFAALKVSLVVAIQHGMLTVLVFGVLILVGSFFLKDIKMVERSKESDDSETTSVASVEEEVVSLNEVAL